MSENVIVVANKGDAVVSQDRCRCAHKPPPRGVGGLHSPSVTLLRIDGRRDCCGDAFVILALTTSDSHILDPFQAVEDVRGQQPDTLNTVSRVETAEEARFIRDRIYSTRVSNQTGFEMCPPVAALVAKLALDAMEARPDCECDEYDYEDAD